MTTKDGDKATVTPISKDADWPTEQILEKAAEQEFEQVIVVGWLKKSDENKDRFWLSASMNSDGATCDLLALAHHGLMDQRMGRDD